MEKRTRGKYPIEQTEIVQTFGQRMRTARELCGYSGIEAAKLLGYENSSKLNKIEHASDTNSVPLWLIPRAAEVYQVSTDFLLGLSDNWQRGSVISQQHQIESLIEQAMAKENKAILDMYNQLSTVEKAAELSLQKSTEIKRLVIRFRAINPEFDDLKLGAKLLRLVDEANQEACAIGRELARYHSSNELKM